MNSISKQILEKFPNIFSNDSHGQDVIYSTKQDYIKKAEKLLKMMLNKNPK
mgnify:CR=1 FL=1